MRPFLIIAILLWASVTKTVGPQTLSTISDPSQGSLPTSTLPEDCLSTVDWHDIVFISAVPIAAGFGLLLLLASLQDLRQAYKSKRSCPLSPSNNWGNRARKERTYVIDVDFAGRSHWGSLLRWCALHKSSGARKHKRLVRLQGTIGFSDWLSFDLILGENQEQKTLTTPRSIGKLVAVEMKSPSASDGLNSRLVPSSNIGACLRGLINRACHIEINNIHVKDTKTQDQYISGCGPSSGGLSSSDQGITTILPLLPWTSPPTSRVNYAAYYFNNGSLWTSTLIPWHQGNFTGSRHITCLFACISYTMVAVQVMSEPLLEPSLEGFVVASPVDFDITMGMVIKAAGISAMLFPFLILMEILGRNTPTILSSCGRPPMLPPDQHENLFVKTARGSQPMKVQSGPGNCYGGGGGSESAIDELPHKSVSAPDMRQQGSRPRYGSSNQQSHDTSSWCNDISKQCAADSITSASDITPALRTSRNWATITFNDISGDNQSICDANMLECHHKFTCYKCPVCKRTTGSRYYDPGAGCSGKTTSVRYSLCDYGRWVLPRYASSSSSPTNVTSMTKISRSTSISCCDWSESASINDSSSCISDQLLDEPAPYNTQGVIGIKAFDDLHIMEKQQTAPSSKEPSHGRPYFISRATLMSGLPDNQHKSVGKREAGDGLQATRYRHKACKWKQKDTTAPEEFKAYSAALVEVNIKSAQVLRTKNYINRFSDMGKGRVMSLPNMNAFLPEDNLNTKKMTDDKSNLSASGIIPVPKFNHTLQAPTECGSVTTGSNYIINLPMESEMPRVTIQRSTSHKSFFFSITKWLAGLRSKPKVDVGDDYKLEVTENDAAINILHKNICVSSIYHGTTDAATIKIKEEANFDTTLSCSSPEKAIKNLSDVSTAENDERKMSRLDERLAQGSIFCKSIFLSSSRMIEYQPDVMSLASSGSWSSITSSQEQAERQPTCLDYINKNNSNQVTIIEVEPWDEPSTSLPIITNTDALVVMDTSQSSSDLSTLQAEFTGNETLSSTEGDPVSTDQSRSPINEGVSVAASITTNKHNSYCMPILGAFGHILLIASCVLAVLWSVSSVHGLCWNAFWEWVATSIIAILIQAVILDTVKAIIVTVLKKRGDKRAATPKPHSLIH